METLTEYIVNNSTLPVTARMVSLVIASKIDDLEFITGRQVDSMSISRSEIAERAAMSLSTVSRAIETLRTSVEWEVVSEKRGTLRFAPNRGYLLQPGNLDGGETQSDWFVRINTWVRDHFKPRTTEHVVIGRFALPGECAENFGEPFEISVRDIRKTWGGDDSRLLAALEEVKREGLWRFERGSDSAHLHVTRLFEPYAVRDNRLFDSETGRFVLPEPYRQSHYHDGWDRFGNLIS